ncbi:hypothetical protein SAMN05444483_10816 [Salegentibacter echinorum]|uniref:Outer membrane protein beta-barrel domain-containing protein n=1 Tax=Salegentibacter echinorum TaxID=1073325 RepID=A0A1M5IKK1_SALEC|nr:hypothetical protein [Salegentibacter echinorum]SHG28569.1 hypothetical protein SAMN05444483_10816 [Salegentibacter echinorum]
MKSFYFCSVFLFLFISFNGLNAQQSVGDQKKWYSTAEIEGIIPYEARYDYGIENRGRSVDLNKDLSLGLLYTFNYMVFNKLSLGVVGGFQAHFNPNFNMPKIGGTIRYFFVDQNNVYVYLHDAVDISLDKSQFDYGNNFRFGLGFPVLKREGFNINTNLFFEQNYLSLNGSDPIIIDEDPGNIFYKSLGLSLGIKF